MSERDEPKRERESRHTWAHVVDTAGTELSAHTLRSRKPKVSDREAETVLEAENVLGLEVSVDHVVLLHDINGVAL